MLSVFEKILRRNVRISVRIVIDYFSKGLTMVLFGNIRSLSRSEVNEKNIVALYYGYFLSRCSINGGVAQRNALWQAIYSCNTNRESLQWMARHNCRRKIPLLALPYRLASQQSVRCGAPALQRRGRPGPEADRSGSPVLAHLAHHQFSSRLLQAQVVVLVGKVCVVLAVADIVVVSLWLAEAAVSTHPRPEVDAPVEGSPPPQWRIGRPGTFQETNPVAVRSRGNGGQRRGPPPSVGFLHQRGLFKGVSQDVAAAVVDRVENAVRGVVVVVVVAGRFQEAFAKE
mmetsp:Transcript_6603/g.14278  ORF Transcript_6603/g.14278 Transcript_6603/m.14278 type:complete len:285 (-) Transcript_6603:2008-2862(-)